MWDWQLTWQALPTLLEAFGVTLRATAGGMALAITLGLVWAVARRARNKLVARVSWWAVDFIRSTPLLVQIYFLFYVLPNFGVAWPPLTTGIIALGLHYSSYTAEVYRAGIEAVPRGQWEAATALNLGRFHTFRAVILPQAIPPVIPPLGNYLVAMFKDTPLLAAITVHEMLQAAKLIGSETFRYLEPLTIVGIIFLVASLVSAQLIRRLEMRLARQ